MKDGGSRDGELSKGGLKKRGPQERSTAPQQLSLRCAPRPPPPPPFLSLRVPAPEAASLSHPPPAAAVLGMGSECAPRSSPGPAGPLRSPTRCCSYPPSPVSWGQRRHRALRSPRLGRVSHWPRSARYLPLIPPFLSSVPLIPERPQGRALGESGTAGGNHRAPACPWENRGF